MKDRAKSKEQPINELAKMRQHLAELEASEVKHKRVGRALLESEEKFRSLVLNIPDVVWTSDENYRIVFASPNIESLTGYTQGEEYQLGSWMMWFERVHPDDVEQAKAAFRELIEEGKHYDINYRFRRKDGRWIWINDRSVGTYEKEGKLYADGLLTDITKRKQTEEKLRESEERYRTIFENTGAATLIVEEDTTISLVNTEFEKIMGYSKEEIEGKKSWTEFVARDDLERTKEYHRLGRIDPNAAPRTYECRVIDRWGNVKNAFITIAMIPGTKRSLASIYDITDRKRAEEALRRAEENFRRSVDDSPLGTRIVSAEGETLYANHAILDIYGYDSTEELETTPGKKRYTPESYAEHQKRKENRQQGEYVPSNYEISIVRKNGEIRHLEVFRKEVLWNGKTQFQVLYNDITERKRAEEALRESEERYRALLNLEGKVGEAIIMLQDTEQGDAIQTFVSKEWPHITGYSEKELLGMSFFNLLHPKYSEAALKRHKRKMGGEAIPKLFEMSIIRKDGTEVPIEVTSAYTTYKGEPANVVFIRDITERKQAEERERQLQQELLLSSRLASLGMLAAGVAHEINNPLTGILGFSERLLRKSTDKEATKDLTRIHNEAARTARVVQNLLTFARRHKPKKEYVDINDILQRALELRAYELKTGNIEVAVDLAPDLPQAMVDFHQIQEVFLNLILNAEQAMSEAHRGGKLSIKTRQIKKCIKISFADDGPGVPAELLDKLFHPFFTTRGERGGTGLGLSICHSIVTGHGGKIYTRNKPEKGATFFVELPVTAANMDESE